MNSILERSILCLSALFCLASCNLNPTGATQDATSDCPNQRQLSHATSVSLFPSYGLGDYQWETAFIARSKCNAHYRVAIQYLDPKRRTEAAGVPPLAYGRMFWCWPLLATTDTGYFEDYPAIQFVNDPIVGGEWVIDFYEHNSTAARDTSSYGISAVCTNLAKPADSLQVSINLGYSQW